jgi:hypothetical protein
MLLSKFDATYAANIFQDFFGSFNRIDDYQRSVKMERMSTFPASLPGMGPETDIFDDFDMHPSDMDFSIFECNQKLFMTYMEITTSAPVESSIPGKQLLYMVKEKNTGKVFGMIRFGSPTINSRPRNEWLGAPLDTMSPNVMKRFNQSAIMGFNIVPVQPVGYNYLAGKLLAGICCSHQVRRHLNKKYDANICLFETTSLYGSSKSSSMYDGMKPFLRHNGLTDSNFAPLINDKNFRSLNDWFKERNGGEYLVPADASSRKLKTQTKMAAIIKSSLKSQDAAAYTKFCQTFSDAKALTEKKRSYYSTYGYEAQSVKDYMNLKVDELKPAENFDRFELESIIAWWRKKASLRYENLKNDGRLRTKLETWNTNADEIDIIR